MESILQSRARFDVYEKRYILANKEKYIVKSEKLWAFEKKHGILLHKINRIFNKIIKQAAEEKIMDISYNPLFKLLIDKGLNKTEFAREVGISSNTLAKLSRNEFVSMEIIVRICRKMDCTVDDILEILPEREQKRNG